MTELEIKEVLANHTLWLNGEGGVCADLRGADLSGANLSGADLSGANLRGANLIRANLSGANLSGANLIRANLISANLISANLRSANLSGADLRGADLRGADLSGADLRGADLGGAKNAKLPIAQTVITPEGDFIGWKKTHSKEGYGFVIVKLLIPASAKRSNGTGRKCRAEYADVIELFGGESGVSDRDPSVVYTKGAHIVADSFDDDRWNECSHGIHFFLTRDEAEAYDL